MKLSTGSVQLFIYFCLIGVSIAAPNVNFDQDESNSAPLGEISNQDVKFDDSESAFTENPSEVAKTLVAAPTSSFFPAEKEESGSAGEIKAPEGIVPAPVGGDTDGRTFHHLAKLHHKVDQKVHYLLHKLFSPWLSHGEAYFGEPHHFSQHSYYDYNNDAIYRKDVLDKPTSAVAQILSPLTKIPKFFVNHPINFKQSLAHLQHAVGKRSINSEDDARQGKTLDKIIPNFEARVEHLMKRVFGDLYGNTGIETQSAYKSSFPIRRRPEAQFGREPISIATIIRHYVTQIPELLNSLKTRRVSNVQN